MNNIFDYVTRREATESKLISGVNCSPESTLDGRTILICQEAVSQGGRQILLPHRAVLLT